MRPSTWFAALLLAPVLMPAVGPVRADDAVSLQLRWDHQFQFAGYYAADWLGFYAEQNISVDIRSAIVTPTEILKPTEEVAAGRADFGIAAADVIAANDRGADLLVVASIFQNSPVVFFAHSEVKFDQPADLVGLRVARVAGSLHDIELMAMLQASGIDPASIPYYAQSVGLDQLIEKSMDVLPGYAISVPDEMFVGPDALQVMRPADYGIRFYGDSLITRSDLADSNPDLVLRFREASLAGWRYALEHPDEIVRLITERQPPVLAVRQDKFEALNRLQARRIPELMAYPMVEPGHLNSSRWQSMIDRLRDLYVIRNKTMDASGLLFDADTAQLKIDRHTHYWLSFSIAILFLIVVIVAISNRLLRLGIERKTRQLAAEVDRRTEIEDALRQANRRMSLATESASIGIWDLDLTTGDLLWDALMYELYGQSPAAFVPTYDAWRDLVHPEDRESADAAAKSSMQTGLPFKSSFRVVWPTGEVRYIEAHAIMLRDPSGTVTRMTGANCDITDRVMSHKALAEAMEQLQDANEARSKFFAAMSHELRTPLNAIMGFSELLSSPASTKPSGEDVQAFTHYIHNSALRLTDMIEQMFDYASTTLRASNMDMQITDLRAPLSLAVDAVSSEAARRNVLLETEPNDSPVNIIGNRDALFRLCRNLLRHAVQRSPDDSKVTVAVSTDGDMARVTVGDAGLPLNDAGSQALLDPFGTVESRTSYLDGTLHLEIAIALGLAKAHNGTLTASSSDQGGVRVDVWLPRMLTETELASDCVLTSADARVLQARRSALTGTDGRTRASRPRSDTLQFPHGERSRD